MAATLRYDRVLHFLVTRGSEDEPTPGETGVEVVPGGVPRLCDDDAPAGWPDGLLMNRAHGFFPTPADVGTHLSRVFELLQRLLEDGACWSGEGGRLEEERRRALGAYVLGLRALDLPAAEMERRRATFGSLARLITSHLDAEPLLAHDPVSRAAVGELASGLLGVEDGDLRDAGRDLEKAVEGARSRHLRAPPSHLEAPSFTGGRPRPQARPAHDNEVTFLDLFGPDPEFDTEGALECLVEAIQEDGRVTPAEWATLCGLGSWLGVAQDFHEAARRGLAVEVEGQRPDLPLDFRALFARLHRRAAADGVITRDEGALLRRIADYLMLRPDEVAVGATPEPEAGDVLYIG